MRRPGNDEPLTHDERLAELAQIFAGAILRLRQRAAWPVVDSEDAVETCLEVPATTVLSDHHG